MTVADPTTGIAPALRADARRPSPASTRSLQFGGLVIAVDVLLAAVSVALLYFVADPSQVDQLAVVLDAGKFAVVGSLAVVAVRAGVRGLRETASGQYTRRTWGIAGIAIGSLFGVLVGASFIATTLMAIGG
ncbi:hypothetical protein BH11ACT4_BH11ACT4_00790 [soil metagenome]